jgi:hypothetical protein
MPHLTAQPVTADFSPLLLRFFTSLRELLPKKIRNKKKRTIADKKRVDISGTLNYVSI